MQTPRRAPEGVTPKGPQAPRTSRAELGIRAGDIEPPDRLRRSQPGLGTREAGPVHPVGAGPKF